MPAYFLTGTDTEIGKTFVACALLHRANQAGLRSVGLKPIAAGVDADGKNDDVLRLNAASDIFLSPEIINPYLLQSPIAPHIAAADENISIDFSRIAACVDAARQAADFVIVEGVGGFVVPLGEKTDTAMLAVRLKLPVILVVGLRLGCLNHAFLTAEAIAARGLALAGWIGNQIDPHMPRVIENIATLKTRLPLPCLGIVGYQADGNAAAASLTLQLEGLR